MVRRSFLAGMGALASAPMVTTPADAQSAAKAATGKRVALVIGIQNYEAGSEFKPLATPINDAVAIARKLDGIRIKSILLTDPKTADLRRGLAEFATQLRSADMGIVYYAGHGIQATREGAKVDKFFAPIDFRAPAVGKTQSDEQRETEVVKAFEAAISAEQIIGLSKLRELFATTQKVGLVFWDACRNNPYYVRPITLPSPSGTTAERNGGRSTRAMNTDPAAAFPQPIADPRPWRTDTPQGVIVQSSTQAGKVAYDGNGTHSPYAAALLNHIDKPSASVSIMLDAVATEVNKSTQGLQLPDVEGSLINGTVTLVLPKTPATQAVAERNSPQPSAPAQQRASQVGPPSGIRDCGGRPCRSEAEMPDGRKIRILTTPESPF